jgi:hypothetical protein
VLNYGTRILIHKLILTVVQDCPGIGMVLILSRMQVFRGHALNAFELNSHNKVGAENFDGYLKCKSECFSDKTKDLGIFSIEENQLLIKETGGNVEIDC